MGLRHLAALALLLLPVGCMQRPYEEATVPPSWRFAEPMPVATGTEGAVVSDAPLATAVGVQILKSGGNAIDAAVGTALALAVVFPEAGNIGGGGFIVARFADGTTASLDFRETAPAAATRSMYVDSAGQVTEESVNGHRAAGVPGAVAGLWEAHRRLGRMPWADVCGPAIMLAENGFPLSDRVARLLQNDSIRFARFESSRALFHPDGRTLAAGTLWRNPDLSAALRRISIYGAEEFYEGKTAKLIVDEMARGGGVITLDDLKAYKAVWRTPIEFAYRGHRIVSMPPPSSGGIAMAQIAGILDGFDLDAMGWHSADAIHVTAEAMRRAFADRNHFLGDPDAVRIPQATLLSPDYIAALRATVSPDSATPSSRISAGNGRIPEGMHTTHLSVVDGAGNAVALTTTINGLHGCAVVVGGAGFLLNNEMDDFASLPGTPNMFGLVQGEANSIAPGKRMLSSMTPTIVLDSTGAPMLVTGARGGPYIITSVFQVISNVVDYGMGLPEAVTAPRIHHQHLPDELAYERGGFGSTVLEGLLGRGHTLRAVGSTGTAPTILRQEGRWVASADPRSAPPEAAASF